MHLDIAGLSIAIAGPSLSAKIELSPALHSYRTFMAEVSVVSPDITVDVDIGTAPPGASRLLMGDGQGIAWYGEGANRRVAIQDGQRVCLWDCRFDLPLRFAKVWIPESLVLAEGGRSCVHCPVVYPLDQCLLMYRMAGTGGAILHAAGALHGGRCALFLGRSGAGKSTVSRQLQNAGGFQLVSDDRMIVRDRTGSHAAFGTPWPGEAGIALNASAPVGALFFLHKAAENRVVALSRRSAFERMLPVASIPWFDPECFPAVLGYLDRLCAEVPAFDLHFRPTPEIADEIVRVMRQSCGP